MTNEIQTITASPVMAFNEDTKALIRDRYFVAGASDAEFELFITQAQHRGLDPTKKHIYAVKRWNSQTRKEEIAYQVSIDGLRLVAHRTGRYEGQTAPMWCGPDGQWRDVWLDTDAPAAAKVGVYVRGFREPTWGIAKWSSYVQTTKAGEATYFWKKMGDLMLAKCAEALALRKAFPEDMGGLYTTEEMHQASTPADDAPNETASSIEVAQPPEQIRDSVIKLVHAVARDQLSWGHDDLKAYYQAQGFDSIKDMTTTEIQEMARLIRDNPDAVRGYMDRHESVDDLARKRADLIDHPEPGLATWNEALRDVSKRLTSHPDYDPAIHADPQDDEEVIEVEVAPPARAAEPSNDEELDAADELFDVTLDELVESGSEDVKDWETMTQMAGDAERCWVKLWDAAPTRLVANMLLARMREEQMVTDATRDARERARTRMMTVS